MEYINKIVQASRISEGAQVLIHFWGEDSDKPIANEFMIAVAAMGATPVMLQQARSINRQIFKNAGVSAFSEEYFKRLEDFDMVLDIFAYQPVILGCELSREKMELYRQYMARLFHALMRVKRFAQIRIPTLENAEESGLDSEEYIRRMEQAYNVDYEALTRACLQERARMESYQKMILKTGKDCVLHLDLSGRRWRIDAGDGDWPCGEIYIAPREDRSNGSIWFQELYIKEQGHFTDVKLFVEAGRIIASNHAQITDYLQKLPCDCTVLCEFGLGMNPNVTDLCGYTVLDEKMAGSFHIAIGANHMFGGSNRAPIHMDFVGRKPFEIISADRSETDERDTDSVIF